MNFRIKALASALVVAFATTHANASSLPALTDTYEGFYKAEAYSDTPGGHAMWLTGSAPSYFGDTDWKFADDSGLLSYPVAGGSASLTGTLVNDSGIEGFDLDLQLGYIQKGGRDAKCEFGTSVCDSAAFAAHEAHFEYFSFITGTLTGTGDLAGIVLSMVMKPFDGKYPFQLGYSANNKDLDQFGASTWFQWEVVENSSADARFAGLTVGLYGHGDINIDLASVPLPAGLVLLLSGLGALGVARRRTA